MNAAFILLQRLVPQHLLSRLMGWLAGVRVPWFKETVIRLFIRVFDVDMSEAASERIEDYENFNAFFTRQLKPNARPVSGRLCSPADGTVSALGRISGDQLFQAKGITYSLEKLLADADISSFVDGSFITIYLAPADYHRVHMPAAANLGSCHYVPGRLFSVNETTTARVPNLFADNERLVGRFQRETGPMAMIMVGAMIVAGIQPIWLDEPWPPRQAGEQVFDPPRAFGQGDEFGSFRMGSTVILLFPEAIDWQASAGQRIRFGEPLA